MSNIEENKILVKKMQRVVFGILCDIDEFCRENNITYYLSGGTCLGAVRHKGFIPWDDDADLMMPRKDYIRFIKLFQKKCSNKYSVGSLYTDDNWQRPFARICDRNSRVVPTRFTEQAMGIFVDIFPIDGLPEGKLKQKVYYQTIKVINALRNSSVKQAFRENEGYRLIKKTVAFVTRPIGPRWFAKKMDIIAKKYDFETSKQVAVSLAIHYWDKETIDRKYMCKPVYLEFEGKKLPVPVGYKKYLSNLYGNYMDIPKDAEQNGYTHLDGWVVEFDINDSKI
ncbi:MAG: LicD family protein [Ruminococcus sp.]|nr:LicD family protein [Ruminococcus sp.]